MNLLSPKPCVQAPTNSPGLPGIYLYRSQLLLHPHHQELYFMCRTLPLLLYIVIPTHVQNPSLRYLILFYRSIRTRIIEESIFSHHCSRLGVLSITVLMISIYLLRECIDLLWYWLMFFTISMVVWRSALMKDVYDRALYFILSMPSLAWIYNEALYLWMWFSIMMPSYMVPTWSYLSSSLPNLPIMTWRFITSPIKVYWY